MVDIGGLVVEDHAQSGLADLGHPAEAEGRECEQPVHLRRVPGEQLELVLHVHVGQACAAHPAETAQPVADLVGRQLAIQPGAGHHHLDVAVQCGAGGQRQRVGQWAAQPRLVGVREDVATHIHQPDPVGADELHQLAQLRSQSHPAATAGPAGTAVPAAHPRGAGAGSLRPAAACWTA